MFQGPGLQILQTVAFDLAFGQNVQFIIQFQFKRTHQLFNYDSGYPWQPLHEGPSWDQWH